MARVGKITLNIDGKEYTFNINVNVKGVFTCVLDRDIAELLGLDYYKREATTLSKLKGEIMEAYKSFLKTTKTSEMIIRIIYYSNGHYSKYDDGRAAFGYGSKLNLSRSLVGARGDGLIFDFDLLIKETYSTGVERVFQAKEVDGEWTTGSQSYHSLTDCVVIPYSEDALKTLEKAKEGIRKVSMLLFDLISKEPQEIVNLLEGGELKLPSKKKG